MDKNMQMARTIAQAVADRGGRVYYVGGLVRDRLRGRDCKDVDIEVHGVTSAALEDILDSLGQRTEMGASFGIYGLRHYDLDIAMPRLEKATGRGHKDFAVFTDPFLGTEKAAMRRDFTINAMMEDVLTGEVVDHFGGREDLQRGVLRHVNDDTFAEDPLRVLRGAQFAARFGLEVAEETIALCRRMDLSPLANERIFGELHKALLKAPRPSVFFTLLRQMHQLGCWFPELEALPEDLWRQTMLVLDAAAGLRDRAREPVPFMVAALCHGVEGVKGLLSRLTSEVRLHRYVLNMRALCGQPRALREAQAEPPAWNRLFDQSACPEDLLLLDQAFRVAEAPGEEHAPLPARMAQALADYRALMALPCVMGADLIAAGVKPGKAMGEALRFAHELHLDGVAKEEALRQTLLRLQAAENCTKGESV